MNKKTVLKNVENYESIKSEINIYDSENKRNIPQYAIVDMSELYDNPHFFYYHYIQSADEYSLRILIGDEAILVGYMMYQTPNLLRKRLSDGKFYLELKRAMRRLTAQIIKETERASENDKDCSLAKLLDDKRKYHRLKEGIRCCVSNKLIKEFIK